MRDATLLRLIGEAETLLTQAETPNFIQAQRLVELLAKLRDADLRARARTSASLNALNAKLDAIVDAMNEDVAAGDRRDAVRAELSAGLERVERVLRAEAEKAEANAHMGEIIARVERRLEAQAEHAAQARATLARVEASLAARAEAEAGKQAQLDVIQRGFEGLHLDNVAKLQRDEALAQRVARLEAAMGDAQEAQRSHLELQAIQTLRESGVRARMLRALSTDASERLSRRGVFTLHKSASMLVWRLMELISSTVGVELHSPNGRRGEYVLDEMQLRSSSAPLRDLYGVFGPFRGYFDIDAGFFERSVLILRDPRDVLVSMFFSWSLSHPVGESVALIGPDGEMLTPSNAMRTSWRERGVDAFALEFADGVERNLRRYFDNLLPHGRVTLLRYERLMASPAAWIESFLAALGAAPDDAAAFVAATYPLIAHEFEPVAEDANNHRRQMTPGDHVRKLKPETIAALTERFRFYFDAVRDGAPSASPLLREVKN